MKNFIITVGISLLVAVNQVIGHGPQAENEAPHEPIDWSEAEQEILANQVQLTFPPEFVKAGEAYFSPDNSRIIFQAIATPPEGEAADEFYAMLVADVVRNEEQQITSIANVKRISPVGSANTCGWFHPTQPNIVIFATTIGPPSDSEAPGYQRGSKSRYRWMFPQEMRIVQCDLNRADGSPDSLQLIAGDEEAYQAEGSLSSDARHLLYCSLESNEGDLFVKDLTSEMTTRIVEAVGYDGGSFFSPDGSRICYRSDRRGDHYLQLFVGELAIDAAGQITGLAREFQLTNNDYVNWCPFWHPSGRFLVYATSAIGHHNYEVFFIEADSGTLPTSPGPVRYGTNNQRITHASGADVLPAFSTDGKTMIWTSQRAEGRSSQLWAADFVFDVNAKK